MAAKGRRPCHLSYTRSQTGYRILHFQDDGSVSFSFSESVGSDATPKNMVYPGVFHAPPTRDDVRQLQVGSHL